VTSTHHEAVQQGLREVYSVAAATECFDIQAYAFIHCPVLMGKADTGGLTRASLRTGDVQSTRRRMGLVDPKARVVSDAVASSIWCDLIEQSVSLSGCSITYARTYVTVIL
jgi:hypothetical protein